jgi:hypothetical protein
MSRVFSTLLLLVWGAWFGSLIGILISVISISHTFPVEVDKEASSNLSQFGIVTTDIFHLFERVQLGLAGAALIFAFAWQLCRGAMRLKIALFVLFAIATVASVVETAVVAPQITKMREDGQTRSAEFGKWHGISGALYGGTLLLMVIGGVILPIGIVRETRARES